jgi:hypothetical protein
VTRHIDVCEYVQDGNTFRITKQKWIQLASYDAPDEVEADYDKAKQLLSSLILDKEIVYEPVWPNCCEGMARWQKHKRYYDSIRILEVTSEVRVIRQVLG